MFKKIFHDWTKGKTYSVFEDDDEKWDSSCFILVFLR